MISGRICAYLGIPVPISPYVYRYMWPYLYMFGQVCLSGHTCAYFAICTSLPYLCTNSISMHISPYLGISGNMCAYLDNLCVSSLVNAYLGISMFISLYLLMSGYMLISGNMCACGHICTYLAVSVAIWIYGWNINAYLAIPRYQSEHSSCHICTYPTISVHMWPYLLYLAISVYIYAYLAISSISGYIYILYLANICINICITSLHSGYICANLSIASAYLHISGAYPAMSVPI